MKNFSTIIESLAKSDYTHCAKMIFDNINCTHFESLMARKGLEKIYRNEKMSEKQKSDLIELIGNKIPQHKDHIEKTYLFLQAFIPVGDIIAHRIENSVTDNFPDSLTVFYYCMGRFVDETPDIIGTAKNVILSIAKKCLKNDVSSINYQLSISLENIYSRSRPSLLLIYQDAIKYGVLIEKYDAISFGSELIESITIDQVPSMVLKLTNPEFEYGLQCGNKYDNLIAKKRYSEDDGYIESFYKCIICKYCRLTGVADSDKEVAMQMLKRQFVNRNQTDLFFFLTGEYQSFVLSILTSIYTQFLTLFFCSSQTMKVITKSYIREKMLWGDVISDEVFNDCYRLVVGDDVFKNTFIVVDEDIVVGRWQLDFDLNIVELAKRISLNAKESRQAGKNANKFGKEIYEELVRSMLGKTGWKVKPSSIKIKGENQTKTDIDLIAYNQGLVIIGQIKFANSGRTRYDIWKAKQTINKAVAQINLSMSKFSEDPNLLYSISKKDGFVASKEDIKKVIPVVITSSSYFIGEYGVTHIPVVSWDIFSQIIESTNYFDTVMNIDGYFSDVVSLYDFGFPKKIVISKIESEEFDIQYEEYDCEDESWD